MRFITLLTTMLALVVAHAVAAPAPVPVKYVPLR